MKEWKIIDVYYSKDSYTCEHCGRVIRNIALIQNNVTGVEMKVGLTCLDKIMNLNEKFADALQREIKSYYKSIAHYKEIMNNEDESIKNKWWETAQIIRDTEKLNKFSKSGLIDLMNLEELKNKFNTLRVELDRVTAIEKEIEKEQRRIKAEEEREIEKTIYIALEDEKIEIKVELIGIETDDGYYGTTYMYEFKAGKYNMMWKTTKDINKSVGDIVNLKGTVKNNRECKEGNYSFLTRCKIS